MKKNITKIYDRADLLKVLTIKLTKEDNDHGPDGCSTCRKRASFAAQVVKAYINRLGDGMSITENLTDLLSDVLHLVDFLNEQIKDEKDKLDFDDMVRRAKDHHSAEVEGEYEQRKFLGEYSDTDDVSANKV
jgi:hypothetical protein